MLTATAWFFACAPVPATDTSTAADTQLPEAELRVPLDAPRLLRRISLDLRGVLPSVEDLDAVAADPDRLTELTERYVDDPLVEERLVRMLGRRWWTRIDDYEATYFDYDLDPEQHYAFLRAVGEEPLRILARVATEDRPWTDVVTVDWSMANELLGQIWDVDYPAGGTGWQEVRYGDHRPAAGVLATNGLWWRYITNQPNMNRGRAAAISDVLLCEDILARPVSLSGSRALNSDELIREDPYCVGCHAHIEPLAATLFGFYWLKDINAMEMDSYHPERERLGEELLEVEPAWFGTPLRGFVDLGWAVAADPRFTACAVQQFSELFWRRDGGVADFDELAALQDVFHDAELRVKPLLAAIVQTPAYTVGWDPSETEVEHRMMGSDLLQSVHAELSGFSWDREGYVQLDNDLLGYRLMAGGVDGEQVFQSSKDPGLTWALVVQRTAEGAARAVVEGELVAGDTRRVFDSVTLVDGTGSEAVAAELRSLSWRLFAQEADEDFVTAAGDLFASVDELLGPEEAWVAVLSVYFRDPLFVGY